MDIGKAFTFVGDDPKWVSKLAIGGGLVLAMTLLIFTVVGWLFPLAIIFGYLMQVTRNVIAGEQRTLPEWENWGLLMSDGFKAFGVVLILALPILLVGLLTSVPAAVLNATSGGEGSAAGVGLSLLGLLGACLLIPLSVLYALLFPIALGRYAATGNIGASLRFGELFSILRGNFVNYLLIFLLTGFVTGTIAQLGVIACVIGVFFTIFYAYLVNHHLYGQAYAKAVGTQPGLAQSQQPYPQSFPY